MIFSRAKSFPRSYLLLLLVDLGVLLIIGFAILFRASFPDPGVEIESRTGLILDLDAHGFFRDVGFLPGDRLLSVQRTPWRRAASVFEGARAGDLTGWTLERGGKILTLRSVIPRLSWPQRLKNVMPLLVALFYWGIATLLWLYNPKHRTIRHFFLLSQLVALILAGGSLGTYTLRWGGYLYYIALIMVIPVTIHFFATFPQRHTSRWVRRLLNLAYGAAWLLLLRLLFIWSGRSFIFSEEAWNIIQLIYLFVALFFAVALLLFRWSKAPPLARQRQRLIVTGMLASLLPFILFYLLPFLLRQTPVISPHWLFISLIFLPLSVAYALRSGEAGAIDWFLNRTLAHTLLFGLLAGLFAGLFWLLNALFPQTRAASLLWKTILALLLAISFSPLYHLLQRWVDQIFYRGWYDYQLVVGKTGKQLARVKGPQQLAQVLLENVTATMKLRCACFLSPLSDDDKKGQIFTHALGKCPLQVFQARQFALDGAFYQALQEADHVITSDVLRQRIPVSPLSAPEKALILCPYAQMWIPTHLSSESSTSDLTATLIVGPNQSGDAFSEEDRHILVTLAQQTALVIRNLKLLLQLQQRERELAQLYKNLTFVREEERKRIARELHDNIIQNIHVIYRSIRDRHALSPELAESNLDQSAQRLKQTMNDVRRICNDLRPATLDVLGLPDAIRSHCERFSERTGISVSFFVQGNEETPLSEETENMLFRILQEALWNVEKHAHARHVDVQLHLPSTETPNSDNAIRLIIQDDGRGMESLPRFDALLEKQSYGLLNMYERAAMIGGRMQMTSALHQGVRIEVTAPPSLPAFD